MQEIVTQICSLPDSGEFFPEEASTPILDLVENPMHLKNLSLKVSLEALTYFASCACTYMHSFYSPQNDQCRN